MCARLISTLVVAVVWVSCVSSVLSQTATAEGSERKLVLHGGKVVTLDGNSTIATAIAIRGSKITAVGSKEQVLAAVGSSAAVVDLGGRTVIPGLIDTHAHLDMQALATLRIDFAGANSIPKILVRIKAETERVPPGTWIVTEPIGEPPHWFDMPEGLAEKRFPNRWDLDKVSPRHPVFIRAPLVRPSAVSIANSLALELAGVTADTKAPDGVKILKDASGEPTGIFEEVARPGPVVQPAFFAIIPETSFDVYGYPEPGLEKTVEVFKEIMAQRARLGLTGVYEGHGLSAPSLRAYRKLHDSGELRLRIYSAYRMDPSLPMSEIEKQLDLFSALSGKGLGDPWFSIGGISNISFRRIPEEKFRQILEASAQRRLRVHANSGQAIEEALKIYEKVDRQFPIRDLRYVMYHCSYATPASIEMMKRLGVVPTSVTNTIFSSGKDRLEELGPEGANSVVPVKSLLAAGIPVSLGSDLWPPSPFFGIWTAVARQDGRTGQVVGPEQKLSREQALRSYSLHGAYDAFREEMTGTLEAGKFADLIVLTDDVLTCPESEIKDIHSLLTIVGGKVTHREDPFESVQSTVN